MADVMQEVMKEIYDFLCVKEIKFEKTNGEFKEKEITRKYVTTIYYKIGNNNKELIRLEAEDEKTLSERINKKIKILNDAGCGIISASEYRGFDKWLYGICSE